MHYITLIYASIKYHYNQYHGIANISKFDNQLLIVIAIVKLRDVVMKILTATLLFVKNAFGRQPYLVQLKE